MALFRKKMAKLMISWYRIILPFPGAPENSQMVKKMRLGALWFKEWPPHRDGVHPTIQPLLSLQHDQPGRQESSLLLVPPSLNALGPEGDSQLTRVLMLQPGREEALVMYSNIFWNLNQPKTMEIFETKTHLGSPEHHRDSGFPVQSKNDFPKGDLASSPGWRD